MAEGISAFQLRYAAIFMAPGMGTMEQPSPEGFVELARAGADVWNAWRKDHPAIQDAQGNWIGNVKWDMPNGQILNLEGAPRVTFAGCNFGDGARFVGQTFKGRTCNFASAIFGDYCVFKECTFKSELHFQNATFGKRVRFSGVKVFQPTEEPIGGPIGTLEGATIGDDFQFRVQFEWSNGPHSSNVVSFEKATIGNGARICPILSHNETTISLDDARFGNDVNFSGVNFRRSLTVRNARFGSDISFANASIERAIFDGSQFGENITFSGEKFGRLSFRRTIFLGTVDFSNRKFTEKTDFTGARFGLAPIFHDCEVHQDTAFTCEESFPKKPSGTSAASRAYRTLKLAMNGYQASREEQFFFRREMREERLELWKAGTLPSRMRSMLFLFYEWLSDYGSSVWRPFVGLIVAWLVMAVFFASAANAPMWLSSGHSSIDWTQTMQWLTYSVANSMPLTGFDLAAKKLGEPLGVDAGTNWHVFLLLLDKILALLFLFLIGLGIRNAFKMK